MKPYRLLRNNQESGPYSAEELIQLGLKAYDLIWQDGKSASWRYPCEIAELKPYAPEVEEQPFDRFFKKPSAVVSPKKETPASPNVNAIPDVAAKPQKPRIRIKADSKIIEVTAPQPKLQKENLPLEISTPIQKEIQKKEPVKPVTPPAQANPAWKDMWLNWEEEKKAVNAAKTVNVKKTLNDVNRFQSSGSINNKAASIKDNVLETKFSQSLDDIKERYVETVLKQKKNSRKPGGGVTVAVLVTAILVMGIYMGLTWSGNNASSVEQKIVDPQPQQVSETTPQNDESNNELKQVDANDEPAKVSAVKNSASSESSHATPKQAVKKNISSTSHTNSVNKNRQQQKVNDSYTYQQPAPIDKAVNKDVIENNASGSLHVNENVQQTAIAKYKKSEPKIADYINVDTYNPSSNTAVGVKLRIQNVSDIPVDLVMLDLQYYDTNGRFEKGETVYVRNIAAGSTITIPAPDYDKAAKVDYKISMVSSEKNNLYLIAD
jgi:hypothetical protein